MVNRHYDRPHRFLCVTNDATGIDSGLVEVIADRADFAELRSPHGGLNPACYRRLLLWHPDAAQWFGERFVSIDLDVVLTADVAPLWDRAEDFVGWQDPFYFKRTGQMCGSMMLLRAGSRPDVWTDFDPKTSPGLAARAGFRGSDQAWISYKLRGAPTWSKADGVYSYRADIERTGRLPDDARIVMFHGVTDPWDERGQLLPWVREHYG